VRATVDHYDDPNDVYRVYLRAGRRVSMSVEGLPGSPTLVLWRPGTKHVTEITRIAVRSGRVVEYRSGRPNPALRLVVRRTGWYYVEVRAPKGKRGGYTLGIAK
jgi:hypothetical protein